MTIGKTLPLPEPRATICAEAMSLFKQAFYYLQNFMIYGISRLETGWWGWGGHRAEAGQESPEESLHNPRFHKWGN